MKIFILTECVSCQIPLASVQEESPEKAIEILHDNKTWEKPILEPVGENGQRMWIVKNLQGWGNREKIISPEKVYFLYQTDQLDEVNKICYIINQLFETDDPENDNTLRNHELALKLIGYDKNLVTKSIIDELFSRRSKGSLSISPSCTSAFFYLIDFLYYYATSENRIFIKIMLGWNEVSKNPNKSLKERLQKTLNNISISVSVSLIDF